MNKKNGWNPYLVGMLIGILAVVSVLATTQILGKTNFLGASTTFVRAVGFLENMVMPQHVAQNEYFQKEKIKIDWQFMVVLGVFLGALISSLLDKSFKIEWVPGIWKEYFGPNPWVRALLGFLGGMLTMFGARFADGCPTGHGLSGMMQLSVSGFMAVALFWLGGFLVARVIYRK
ncbi:MAG: YeeE/YedE family protein [Candidatus Omnitrophica bacterium]|nr:YeeE/YedE family protein [Candidatus Omnitrophota bacterium]